MQIHWQTGTGAPSPVIRDSSGVLVVIDHIVSVHPDDVKVIVMTTDRRELHFIHDSPEEALRVLRWVCAEVARWKLAGIGLLPVDMGEE